MKSPLLCQFFKKNEPSCELWDAIDVVGVRKFVANFGFHPWIHQSSIATIIGIFFGGLIRYEIGSSVRFDRDLFFYLVLPPIIFSAGYGLKKKKFFKNFSKIIFFGFFGTILTFVLNSFAIYYYGSCFPNLKVRNFQWIEAMLLSSVISASDEVSALSLVQMKDYPKLGSIIFGEGIVNDIVSIVLFKTIHSKYKDLFIIQSTESNESTLPYMMNSFQTIDAIHIFLQFCWEFICSSFIGLFISLLTSRCFKIYPWSYLSSTESTSIRQKVQDEFPLNPHSSPSVSSNSSQASSTQLHIPVIPKDLTFKLSSLHRRLNSTHRKKRFVFPNGKNCFMKTSINITDPIHQTALLFLSGYFSYSLSESLHLSGILTLFLSSILLSHYCWHNLHWMTQLSTRILSVCLSEMAEGFSFSYVGLSLWTYIVTFSFPSRSKSPPTISQSSSQLLNNDIKNQQNNQSFLSSSFRFVPIMNVPQSTPQINMNYHWKVFLFSSFVLIVLIISRFAVIFSLSIFLKQTQQQHKSSSFRGLSLSELFVLSIGGMVRGCLCWAQVLQIEEYRVDSSSPLIFVPITLFVVIGSSTFGGIILPALIPRFVSPLSSQPRELFYDSTRIPTRTDLPPLYSKDVPSTISLSRKFHSFSEFPKRTKLINRNNIRSKISSTSSSSRRLSRSKTFSFSPTPTKLKTPSFPISNSLDRNSPLDFFDLESLTGSNLLNKLKLLPPIQHDFDSFQGMEEEKISLSHKLTNETSPFFQQQSSYYSISPLTQPHPKDSHKSDTSDPLNPPLTLQNEIPSSINLDQSFSPTIQLLDNYSYFYLIWLTLEEKTLKPYFGGSRPSRFRRCLLKELQHQNLTLRKLVFLWVYSWLKPFYQFLPISCKYMS